MFWNNRKIVKPNNIKFFADDTALIAETEEELQRLLDVASAFVIKWNLSFNFKGISCWKKGQ